MKNIIINKKTPFDREKNDIPLIKLLIHTESFHQAIIDEELTINSLIDLSQFKFLNIIFTPTDSNDVIKILEQKGVEITEYKQCKDFITIKSRTFENVVLMGKDLDKYKNNLVEGSCVNKIDLFTARNNYFDYFVVSKNDNFFKSKYRKSKDVDSIKAIDLVRILLVNLGYFYVNPYYKVNEGYYYLYRFKKLFFNYQYSWSNVVSLHGKNISEDVFNQFDSLSLRLEMICRAADKVSFYDLKYANNDTQDNTVYHLGYLIMLITGVFDDIAWIITKLYSLKLSNMEVGLKIPSKKTSTKFYNKLHIKNIKLYEYLTNNIIQNKIKMVYPLRDTLQHREFMKGIHYLEKSSGYEKNLYRIPEKVVDCIKVFSKGNLKEFGIMWRDGNLYYIEAYTFVSNLLNVVTEIINNVLVLIDWKEYLKILSTKELEALQQTNNKFNQGIGKFLGWCQEPIYF